MIINSKNTSFFNQPELHFSSDKSSWEEEKLGSNILLTTGKLDANASNENGNYAFFTCNKETLKTDTYAFDCDAILINGNGDLGFTRKYSGKFNAYQRTYVLTNFKHNFAYLEEVIKKYLPKKVSQEAFGGAMPYIRANTITDLDIYTPSMKIQEKVSCLLSNIEEKIKKQEILLNKLKNTKASLLIKMFPQNNEDIPELRFAGFTDTWEQRKVKELCLISTGKSNTQDKTDDGKYPFYVRSPIVEKSNKYLYDEEAVITIGDGVGTGKVFHYINGKYDLHQRCYRMYNFSNNLNAKYFYHIFAYLFYDRVMSMTAKTSVDSVRLDMIADMQLPTPNIYEQQKISALFENLDNLITLHQRKLDKLKEVKSALLDKLLV